MRLVAILLSLISCFIATAHADFVDTFDLHFETSHFLGAAYLRAYRIQKVCGHRLGFGQIVVGIVRHNPKLIDRGMAQIQSNLSSAQIDGRFKCPDAFYSTAQIVEDASHAFLLLNASAYADPYRDRIKKMLPALHLSAKQLIEDAQIEFAERQIKSYSRRFFEAIALGQAGVLSQDNALLHASEIYLLEGKTLAGNRALSPDNFYALERYYVAVANDDAKLSLRLYLDQKATELKKKGFQFRRSPSAYRALAYYYDISGDPSYLKAAKQIFESTQPHG